MNRITRERLKKQRAAKGFTGIQIKDLGKFFKRKEIQPPTPSGVKPKADAPKSSTTNTTTSVQETKNDRVAGRIKTGTPTASQQTQTQQTSVSEKDAIRNQIKNLQARQEKAGKKLKFSLQQQIDKLKAKL